MKVALQLENLSVGYAQHPLITSINAQVYSNEFVVILGKNGVGKSTLLHTLLGFEAALEGQIYYSDRLSTAISSTELAKEVAVVFPKLTQTPKITVFETLLSARIAHHRVLRSYSEEEILLVNQTMDLVGIAALKDLYLTEISEGQLQLVMIARALCQETSIVFLDEPTANLDLENQFKIYELILKLKAETNKTFIMVTHDAELALTYADRVWWIENQQLKDGVPEDVALEFQLIPKLSGGYLQFDAVTATYLHSKSFHQQLKVVGTNELAYWVKKALVRKGFQIDENSLNFVEVVDQRIFFASEQFETISSLLNYLEHEKYNYHRSE